MRMNNLWLSGSQAEALLGKSHGVGEVTSDNSTPNWPFYPGKSSGQHSWIFKNKNIDYDGVG